MPVAIVGPGRSGTSVVSRLLNLCGLYLGEERDIMPPASGNPDGYWEHLGIVQVNDELLDHFGGGWDVRPSHPDWSASGLEPIRETARGLIASLSTHGPWGWKDPRTSFTLPFWQALVPDLKVIMCVRHPAQVAGSLAKQHHTSLAYGVRWWMDCVSATCEAADPFLVLFDTLVEHPREYLGQLCEFSGLLPSEEALSCVRSSRRGEYPHKKVGSEAEQLYDELKARALGNLHDVHRAADRASNVSPAT